jgi:hypothetical protein
MDNIRSQNEQYAQLKKFNAQCQADQQLENNRVKMALTVRHTRAFLSHLQQLLFMQQKEKYRIAWEKQRAKITRLRRKRYQAWLEEEEEDQKNEDKSSTLRF